MLRNFLLMSLLVFIIIFAILKSAFGETNTVSSTVVTNNTPPTANSPSVVVNNSDVCRQRWRAPCRLRSWEFRRVSRSLMKTAKE